MTKCLDLSNLLGEILLYVVCLDLVMLQLKSTLKRYKCFRTSETDSSCCCAETIPACLHYKRKAAYI